MKYGFIIDNRKCIGCHACTTACKSEHEVPLGVFRTYVKQVEKGAFPDTRRLFSVLRCNHCTDAPCVEICPVEALFIRQDGIVDFDKNRCIGCKSCMQACPYDALYIDPDTHTAAKCNYCAHRVDVGLEPACVVVCPEHAIISGDMEDPASEISGLLAREQTTVRKPEKGTIPNLYYIEGDAYTLVPTAAAESDGTMWSSQARGVGHFAQYTERMAWQGEDLVKELLEKSGHAPEDSTPQRSIEVLTGHTGKKVYDTPSKGVLWGWEVSAYVTTKAVASGIYLLATIALLLGLARFESAGVLWALGLSFVFVLLTTGLLVKDLDQPGRFLYVLLRPQWRSWLVRGGYALVIFSGLTLLQLATAWFGNRGLTNWLSIPGIPLALIVSVYTALLFAQARGRDFWQSPVLPLHMLTHSLMAGSAGFLWLDLAGVPVATGFAIPVLIAAIIVNLSLMAIELAIPHPTSDARATVKMILGKPFGNRFRWGVVVLGNLLPLAALWLRRDSAVAQAASAAAVLCGIYLTEKIWIEAPQRIPLA